MDSNDGSPQSKPIDHKKKKSIISIKLFNHSNSSPNLKLLDKNGELIPIQQQQAQISSTNTPQKISGVTPSQSSDSLWSMKSSSFSSSSTNPKNLVHSPSSSNLLSLKLSTNSTPSLTSSQSSFDLLSIDSNYSTPNSSSNSLSSSPSLNQLQGSGTFVYVSPTNSPQNTTKHQKKPSKWKLALKKVKSSNKLKKEIEELSQKSGLNQQYTKGSISSPTSPSQTAQDRKKSQRKSRFINTSLAQINDYTIIPKIIKLSIEYLFEKSLQVPGIFRESANALELQKLSSLISSNDDEISLAAYKDPHCIAGLIKLYFREKPSPVFPYELHKLIHNILEDSDKIVKIKSLLELGLSEGQFYIIRYLFELLNSIHNNQEFNKMNSYNLAVCFAPTLIHSFDSSCIDVIISMIEDYEQIFSIDVPVVEENQKDEIKLKENEQVQTKPLTEENDSKEEKILPSNEPIEINQEIKEQEEEEEKEKEVEEIKEKEEEEEEEEEYIKDSSFLSSRDEENDEREEIKTKKRSSTIIVQVHRNHNNNRAVLKSRPISLNDHRKPSIKIKRLSSISNKNSNISDFKKQQKEIQNNNNNNNNNNNLDNNNLTNITSKFKDSTDSFKNESEEEELQIIPMKSRPTSVVLSNLSSITNLSDIEDESMTDNDSTDISDINSTCTTTSHSNQNQNEISESNVILSSPNVKSIVNNVNADNVANVHLYNYKYIPNTSSSKPSPFKPILKKYSSAISNSSKYNTSPSISSKINASEKKETPYVTDVSNAPKASSLISNYNSIIKSDQNQSQGGVVVKRKLDSVKKNISKYEKIENTNKKTTK